MATGGPNSSRQARNFAAVCVLLVSTGCSDAAEIVVGSKNFSENVVLGELVAQHIEARTDLTVERRLSLGGTFICHQAMLSGDLDIYPEYTGTALTAILRKPVMQDPKTVFEEVAIAYRQNFEIGWLKPFGFNNTYAMVVRAEDAERDGLRSISDFARLAPQRTIGFSFEFAERQDGYQGFIKTYDLEFEQEPKTVDLGLIYRALRDGEIDLAVGNSTDGLIAALNLQVLEDDRRYFPPYDAAPLVRTATLQKHPELTGVINELGGLFTDEEMQKINYAVDGENEPVAEVARKIRAQKGL